MSEFLKVDNVIYEELLALRQIRTAVSPEKRIEVAREINNLLATQLAYKQFETAGQKKPNRTTGEE